MSWILLCAVLSSPTVLEFKLLPPGHDGQVKGVGQARYYLLEEYLELNVFDQELVKLRIDFQDLGDINTKFKLQLKEKDKIVISLVGDKAVFKVRSERLAKDLEKAEEEIIDLAGGPFWPYVVAIIGAAVGIAGVSMWIESKIPD